jgi:hypothetical protein
MLKQKRTDPPPSYCPNCAIHNLKGMMALVEETKESRIGPHVSTSQTSRRLC